MHVDGSQAMTDLAEYRAKHGLWAKDFVWASAEHVLPHVWWTGVCSTRALSVVASRILNMPASSAACERSFSAYGNIHTAKRNRLTNETAGKLVYVYHNLKQIGTEDGPMPLPVSIQCTRRSAPAATSGDSIGDADAGSESDETELDEEDSDAEFSLEEDEIRQ
jgi:hypothetical protein